jgi:hypothetical protein
MGSLATSFVYKFLGGSRQNSTKNLIYTRRSILLRNLDSATGRVSDICNSKTANHLVDHWKAERVTYCMVFGTFRVSANLRPKR